MFTGLVSEVGTVERILATGAGLELAIRSGYSDLEPGESVAVSGACLTVRDTGAGIFTVAAVETTLQRTAIAGWKAGRRVNLERAVRMGDRLGGHLVQGHVDCVGTVTGIVRQSDAVVVGIAAPVDIWELLAPLGSVAIEGVSLTVHDLPARGSLRVSLIGYTLEHTTLAELAVGDELHVEADMIAKHVKRLLEPYMNAGKDRFTTG